MVIVEVAELLSCQLNDLVSHLVGEPTAGRAATIAMRQSGGAFKPVAGLQTVHMAQRQTQEFRCFPWPVRPGQAGP